MSDTATTDAPDDTAEEQAKKPAKAKAAPKAKASKDKAKAKGKKAGGNGAKLPSVANHPRAGAQITRMKAWGGLGGFLLVAALSWRAGVPGADLLLRALMAGAVGYVMAWAAAVAVWRHLVIAELRAVRSHHAARAARAAAAAAENPR